MRLPRNHRLTIPPSFLKPLTRRDPANPNAPGLEGNKNGPPGPEGNQKGPNKADKGTEALGTPTSQIPPSETVVLDGPAPPPTSFAPANPPSITSGPASPLDITSSSVLVTFVASAPPTTSSVAFRTTRSVASLASVSTSGLSDPGVPGTQTSYLAPAVSGTVTEDVVSAMSFMESLTTPDVSASSAWALTSVQYSVLWSPSSAVSDATSAAETTPRTSFTYTSNATAVVTGWGNHTPNGTAQSESNAVSPGQRAGVAVGTIAGFSFILTLIVLLFKWRRSELPKTLPRACANSHWQSHSQTSDAMLDSVLAAEAGSSGDLAWNYRATFAEPTVIEKVRQSLRKSLKLFQVNPLALNPVTPPATEARTPSRKSFASFFHRRSAASTLRNAFGSSSLQEQSGSVIGPHSHPPLLPPHAALPSPRPSAMSGRSTELAQSVTEDSPRFPTMPPQTLLHPWRYRNSQMTMASAESNDRSIKGAPGWVKPHHPSRLCTGVGAFQEAGKELPLPPLSISPGSWLKAKIRSYSTTALKDGIGHHIASDKDDESAGTERVVFGQSEQKKDQVGRRISGASADSLDVEKQEAWQV